MSNRHGDFYVERADPRVLIAEAHLHESLPVVAMGDILKIEGVNRRVIYRIVDYLPDQRAYLAEWPD